MEVFGLFGFFAFGLAAKLKMDFDAFKKKVEDTGIFQDEDNSTQ